MKVLCISKWAKAPSPEERDAILPKEVRATLKLYLDGVIEQMWFKLDAPGVVFLVNAESVDAAKNPRAWPAAGPSRPDGRAFEVREDLFAIDTPRPTASLLSE